MTNWQAALLVGGVVVLAWRWLSRRGHDLCDYCRHPRGAHADLGGRRRGRCIVDPDAAGGPCSCHVYEEHEPVELP